MKYRVEFTYSDNSNQETDPTKYWKKEGKKPRPSSVLPDELGMVLHVGHRDVNHLDVVQACQRGDEEAFRVLFESHKDRVYSIALRYAGGSRGLSLAPYRVYFIHI